MSHPDSESLALLALGESAEDSELQRHLDTCVKCRDDFESLRRTVDLCREITDEDYPTEPPGRVWDCIANELGLSEASQEATPEAAAAVATTGPAAGGADDGTVVDLAAKRQQREARRGWSRGPILAVAAAAVLGVAAGGVLTTVMGNGEDSVTVTVVAGASLDPLPGKQFVGVAEVGQADTGRVLSVEVDGAAPEGGYYEVWLLTPSVEEMISIGALDRANSGLFRVPEGVDLDQYRVVDVSFEPFDGDPTHSSDSIVRGELEV